MPTGRFEQALAGGRVVVVGVEPPRGPDLEDFVRQAESVGDRAAAFLVGDNPQAAPRVAPLAAARLLAERGLETIVTLSCRDRNRLALAADLLGAQALGLKNILAVTGDHPVLGPVPQARPVYDLDAVQLLGLIRDLNQGRGLDGEDLARPTELFAGASVHPEAEPAGPQKARFRLKVAAGAAFFFSQGVFDPGKFTPLAQEARNLKVKLLAGLRLFGPDEIPDLAARRRPGLAVPADLLAELEARPEQALETSLARAREIAAALKDEANGFVLLAPGLAGEMPRILDELDLG